MSKKPIKLDKPIKPSRYDTRKLTPTQRLYDLTERGQKVYGNDFSVSDRELDSMENHFREEESKYRPSRKYY